MLYIYVVVPRRSTPPPWYGPPPPAPPPTTGGGREPFYTHSRHTLYTFYIHSIYNLYWLYTSLYTYYILFPFPHNIPPPQGGEGYHDHWGGGRGGVAGTAAHIYIYLSICMTSTIAWCIFQNKLFIYLFCNHSKTFVVYHIDVMHGTTISPFRPPPAGVDVWHVEFGCCRPQGYPAAKLRLSCGKNTWCHRVFSFRMIFIWFIKESMHFQDFQELFHVVSLLQGHFAHWGQQLQLSNTAFIRRILWVCFSGRSQSYRRFCFWRLNNVTRLSSKGIDVKGTTSRDRFVTTTILLCWSWYHKLLS